MKLFNGDCRDVMQSDEYLQYIDNKNVIVVTDPPFNIGFRYDKYKDNMPESDYMDMLTNICKGAAVVIHYPEGLYRLAIEMKRVPEKVVAWVYNSHIPKQHRDIAFWGVVPDLTKVIQPFKTPKTSVLCLKYLGEYLDVSYMIGGISNR